ncbi:MAG TPA: thiolase domain-containing protein [Candidatus Limnocylindrales bacterium]|nr:thiolase domain-containing protein [Candidatus Limnocylindrales bacterium]
MKDVAVVALAQSPPVRRGTGTTSGVDMLVPLLTATLEQTGLSRQDIGFWCSGSSDYLAGRAFSFVNAVDALGAYPPINESHVEMDGAWALYEAWVKIQTGEVDTALVYGFGKSSAGDLNRILALQLDPYLVAPLWPDARGIAALQARLGIEAGLWTEKDMAQIAGGTTDDPYVAEPLREHDCAPFADGAAVVVLASAGRAEQICDRPAWITGIEHRVEPQSFDRLDIPWLAGLAKDVDIVELHAPYTHQEIILRRSLRLADDVIVNPGGGVLIGHAMFAAGLARVGEAARHIIEGRARRTLAHATSGPALQQNLICVLAEKK